MQWARMDWVPVFRVFFSSKNVVSIHPSRRFHPPPSQASKEGDRARLEAVALREEKSRVETQANALTRENRVLQDRLNGGQLRDKARERER